MAWQLMPFFNFPHYKSMETLTCHSNQTKEPISIKHKFQSPSPRMPEMKFWLQRRCRLKVLTPDRRRRQRTTAYPISSPGSGEPKQKAHDKSNNRPF